jgi:hypothetical protein
MHFGVGKCGIPKKLDEGKIPAIRFHSRHSKNQFLRNGKKCKEFLFCWIENEKLLLENSRKQGTK